MSCRFPTSRFPEPFPLNDRRIPLNWKIPIARSVGRHPYGNYGFVISRSAVRTCASAPCEAGKMRISRWWRFSRANNPCGDNPFWPIPASLAAQRVADRMKEPCKVPAPAGGNVKKLDKAS